MSHPDDASTKYLVQVRPADWLALIGHPTQTRVELLDIDLSTVTSAADRAMRVHDDPPWVFHLELQSSRDNDLVTNLHLYNALLERRYGPPVRTVVVLLRRSADAPDLTGMLQREFSGEPPYLMFRYQAIRVWQLSPEELLNSGLGLLPLAPSSDVSEDDLPAVLQRLRDRVHAEATAEEGGRIWKATAVLMGLRYSAALIAQVARRLSEMNDSTFYQFAEEFAGAKVRQADLLRLGGKKFGAASTATESALRAIEDRERLARMLDRLVDGSAADWDDLLATP
jgi:predicted transposase YdaD